MPKFRKKSVMIEAVQLNWENRRELVEFLGDVLPEYSPLRHDGPWPGSIEIPIPTPVGNRIARTGHWLVKQTEGKFCRYETDAFEAIYEPVDD
jgi:hypothetical protein